MKDTFLQAVSHDLRTPLAAILGLAITLERGDVGLSPEETRNSRVASSTTPADSNAWSRTSSISTGSRAVS